MLRQQRSLIVVTGEADGGQRATFQRGWQNENVRFATNLPLRQLAAVLSQCFFIGHDSGISHLAAAVGAPSVVLFGPTDPAVWAPLGDHVQVIKAESGDLKKLSPDEVLRHPKLAIRQTA